MIAVNDLPVLAIEVTDDNSLVEQDRVVQLGDATVVYRIKPKNQGDDDDRPDEQQSDI